MNEDVKSLKEAQQRVDDITNKIKELEMQKKNLQSRYTSFLDNPQHQLNLKVNTSPETTVFFPMYVDSNSGNTHFAMRYSEVLKHFDEDHMPIYFINEVPCAVFADIYKQLQDILKFKMLYDKYPNNKVSNGEAAYYVTFDLAENKFVTQTTDRYQTTTVYFYDETVANNCCTWMNYKYKCN